MEVITEGTNSPKLTLSGSPPRPPPTPFLPRVFASGSLSLSLCHNFLSLRCLQMSRPAILHPLSFQKRITHLKSFLFQVSPCHMSLQVSLCVYLSVHSDTSLSDCVRLRGVQVFRHSLQPRLLDHYYSIISSDGGHAADA